MCLMHDSIEYGVLRWELKEISHAVGCTTEDLENLIKFNVLKGNDIDKVSFSISITKKNTHSETIILIDDYGPLWYSSRMVRDEYIRNKRAQCGFKSIENPNVPRKKAEQKTEQNKVDNDTLSRIDKDTLSPSPSSSSSSSIINNKEIYKERKKTVSAKQKKEWTALAEEIVYSYPRVASDETSINHVYKLLTLKNDKVGKYRELQIENIDENDIENIVKERAIILKNCISNYKRYCEISGKEGEYIIQSNNFFNLKINRWREFLKPPKEDDYKKAKQVSRKTVSSDGIALRQEDDPLFPNYRKDLENKVNRFRENLPSGKLEEIKQELFKRNILSMIPDFDEIYQGEEREKKIKHLVDPFLTGYIANKINFPSFQDWKSRRS